jgi:iron complex outermembrane receptor protein
MRFLVLLTAALLVQPAASQRVGAPTTDLDKLSVDDLFNIQVTSVGKKAEQLSKAPAAVFVLTADDIRRTGATCIPEALQWVPGLTVLQLDDRSWVVSARGGARTYANKILVMIDGRSLYTPLFGGVIWDAIGVPMDDIERIEVMRGPGAVMWGLNAVNGVINIITKPTKTTKGGQLSASTGNEVRESTDLRWGGGSGDNLSYRIWGQSDYLTPAYGSSGVFPVDQISLHSAPLVTNLDAATTRFGFRMDTQSGTNDWMVQGDLYKMDRQDPTFATGLAPDSLVGYQGHTHYDGGYLQGRWTQTGSGASESSLQFTYGNDSLNYPGLGADVHNLTVDYQKREQTSDRNEVYWGVGYQRYWDEISGGSTISFNPPNSGYQGGNVVVRDEYQLVPGRWLVSAGARLDYTSYSHLQYEPSLRLLFTPDSEHSLWLAASRALRQPSRIDLNMDINAGTALDAGLPVTTQAMGSPYLKPEVERSLEAGYKMQSGQRWSLDFSVFWSYYQSLVALESPAAPAVTFTNGAPNIEVTGYTNNAASGRSYGGEVWGEIQVRPGWRIIPAYSYLSETRWLPPNGSFVYSSFAEIASFPHQGQVRSQFDLSRTWKLDLMARARSRDTDLGLPGALLVDARLSWRPSRSTEFSVTAKDIANRQIYEGYPEGFAIAIPTRRTVVFQLRQRF